MLDKFLSFSENKNILFYSICFIEEWSIFSSKLKKYFYKCVSEKY